METLTIAINDRRKIFAIQEEFNHWFPNLKIEFFSKPHTKEGPHSDKINKEPGHRLADCRTVHTSGTISIRKDMSIADLERNFQDVFGLKIRVLRKSGNDWLGITNHDLTLQEQNIEELTEGLF